MYETRTLILVEYTDEDGPGIPLAYSCIEDVEKDAENGVLASNTPSNIEMVDVMVVEWKPQYKIRIRPEPPKLERK